MATTSASTKHTAHGDHPYHLVDPSPWPLVGSIGSFLTFLGAIFYAHEKSWPLLLIGLAVVVITMVGWWRDVIVESQKEHTPTVQNGLRIGMALFITTEVMFFAAFFWAFFDAAIFPMDAIGNIWPPKDIVPLDPFTFPYLNTLLLLLSGCAVTYAHQEIVAGRQANMALGLAGAVALGVIFLGVQAFEYHHAAFPFEGGIYSSTFYMATGFHGFHVFVGASFLFVCLLRARQGQFKAKQHVGFESAAWYWHFVDVVWLFLFVSIYWWGGQ